MRYMTLFFGGMYNLKQNRSVVIVKLQSKPQIFLFCEFGYSLQISFLKFYFMHRVEKAHLDIASLHHLILIKLT